MYKRQGTGSISIELVSRGCDRVISVEKDGAHHAFISKIMKEVQTDKCLPIRGDVFKFINGSHERFDFIFADPPYELKEDVYKRQIYDDVGCWHVPHRFFEEMRDAGIEVRSFLKVRFPLFTSKVNYRNHRKIVVIDGRIGFIGGMNLAERYMRGFSWGIWRDTHISVSYTHLVHQNLFYHYSSSFLEQLYCRRYSDGR